jgi:hypothetical protein
MSSPPWLCRPFLNLAPTPRRGVAGGVLTASVFIGQFCSPLLSTPMISGFGYAGLFLGAFVVLAAVAVAALIGSVMRSR